MDDLAHKPSKRVSLLAARDTSRCTPDDSTLGGLGSNPNNLNSTCLLFLTGQQPVH